MYVNNVLGSLTLCDVRKGELHHLSDVSYETECIFLIQLFP